MAPLPIKSFISELKSLTKAGEVETRRLLKTFKSEIKSLDEVVLSFEPKLNRYGFVELNGNSIGRVTRVLSEGDLAELVKISGKNVAFTSVDAKAFKSLVADTPERAYKEVSDLALSNKKSFPQLDIKENGFSNMSSTAVRDVKKVENNLFKYFKQGTTIALTLGAVYVGVDWLTKATEKRKGCFMLTTINGKTTSCKVQAYSCVGTDGDFCQSQLTYYNTTLVLMHVASLPDTDPLKIKVAQAAGIDSSKLSSSLASVIDSKYAAIDAVISAEKTKPLFNICELKHQDVEKGVVPPCRMCSPSDNPISTTYIDPAQYPANVTFTCSINPSLLDTIADAAKSTGRDILDGVSSGLSKLLKPFLMIALILIVIVIAISIFMKVIKSSGNKTNNNNT